MDEKTVTRTSTAGVNARASRAAGLALLLLASGCRSTADAPAGEAYVPAGRRIALSEYATRRRLLMQQIPDGVAIVPGALAPLASYPFRQNNDFLYLTGVEVPGAYLVVDGIEERCALFFDLDEHGARGEGLPLDLVHDPLKATGCEEVLPVERLADHLRALHRRSPIFYVPLRPQELPRINSNEAFRAWQESVTESPWDGRLTRQLQLAERLRQEFAGLEVLDCSPFLRQMRKHKSPAEVALIRRAAQIAVEGHLELMRATAPGVDERALAALFEFICLRAGAQDLAYATILMAGPHHPFGHYHRYDRILEDGDFVILDAGPDFAYYDADVSTSFPASGTFSPLQRELYELAEAIHQVCLRSYRPGITLRDVGAEVAAFLRAGGHDPDDPRFRSLCTWGGYNHPIGMATHDVMPSISGPDEPLQPGFVFACDINMPAGEQMGVRIEDTVVITEGGCEVLSAGLPRSVGEIEALMRRDGLLQRLERR